MTAYWLVYVSDNDIKTQLTNANIYSYDPTEKN